MPRKKPDKEVALEKLRWRLDPATLPFETTEDLKPLKEIIGQKRGVDAFRCARVRKNVHGSQTAGRAVQERGGEDAR
jgi:hypothetical protein